MPFLGSLFTEVLAGLIGTSLGFMLKIGIDRYRALRRNKHIVEFFKPDSGKIAIIHSSIYDIDRKAYNVPASDTVSVRKLSSMLENAGYSEGKEFFIAPDIDFLTDDGDIHPKAMNYNLILTCAPKRNKVTEHILEHSASLRYQMTTDPETNENLLFDTRVEQYLRSSRDIVHTHDTESHTIRGYDFGLIVSMPNPIKRIHNVVILAGIHGAGTIGCSMLVTDTEQLKELCRRRRGNIIAEIVRAEFVDDYENIVNYSLC